MSFWASEMSDLAVNNSISYLINEKRLYLRINLEKKYKLIIMARSYIFETNSLRSSFTYIRISKSH